MSDAEILMRVFELDGEGTVYLHIWPPQPDSDGGPGTDCHYQITGIGSEKMLFARGIDGAQSITLALRMAASQLFNSPEYHAGRLTFCGTRDLFFPEVYGRE